VIVQVTPHGNFSWFDGGDGRQKRTNYDRAPPASRLPAGALDSADRVAIRPFSLLAAATPTSSLTRARMRTTIINWDHLIGDSEQCLRYGDAQQPCGL
jgi:hypothetical protein